ncbi:MAG: DMT family transporter [Proteobacteria bacterium]|nr:DMT family transporter [Pseudomonadota bacterium]MBI3500037.1 DMT family transporter [Pseudomonadota bacterium]
MPHADIAPAEIARPPLAPSLRKNRLLGIGLMVTAATGFSLAGVLVRQTETTAWEVVFWRSVFMVLVVATVLFLQHRLKAFAVIRAVGWIGLVSAFFLASSFYCFVLAIKHTTVANTVVIMSAAPFVTALAGWMVLGERVPPRTWIALVAAATGIALMFWESLATGTGLLGNVFAFGIAITYAGQVTPLRMAGANLDMAPTALLAGLMASAIGLPLAWPFSASAHDVGVFAVMGVFQIGLPNVLMIRAARYLSATEIVLLGMVEVVLGPIWVWLAIAERPSDLALIGGAIVLAALAGNALAGSRRGAA